MKKAAIRRAVLRLDRNLTSLAMLAAGIALSVAGFAYLGRRDAANTADLFRAAAADRARAVCRETESLGRLLEVVSRLAARGETGVIRTAVEGHRGARRGGVVALWVEWNGVGEPATAGRVYRSDAGPGILGERNPPWLGDAVRRAAGAGRVVTVPAAADGAGELLVFAAGVFDGAHRLLGVALALAPVADLVEYGLGHVEPLGVDFV
ncbi:MAG: hypothetical protein KGN36_09975, partial [Acidobacteriota bacterium]|nr:hypothetical protein [Acidobacteriota bacterium]